MNPGQTQGDKTAQGDERYTPKYAVRPLLNWLTTGSIVWCPFDEEWSAFPQVLKEAGYSVIATSIHTGKDFFTYTPEEFDVILSNPPWSKKEEVLAKCEALGKPYALLLPIDVLQGHTYFKYFDHLQLLLLDQRVEYYQAPNFREPQRGVAFSSAYFCKKFLFSDLKISKIERTREPLLTPTQAEKFGVRYAGDKTLDMFEE